MKTLKGSLLAKTIAVILLIALCLAFAASALGLALLYSYYRYDGTSTEGVREEYLSDLCTRYGWRIADRVFPAESAAESNRNLSVSRNLRYEIYDANGVLRISTLDGAAVQAEASFRMEPWFGYSFMEEGTLWSEEGIGTAEGNAADGTVYDYPVPVGTPELMPAPTLQPTAEDAALNEPLPTPLPTQSGAAKIPAEVMPTPHPAAVEDYYSDGYEVFNEAPGFTPPGEVQGRSEPFTVKVYLLRDLTVRDSVYWELRSADFVLDNSRAMLPLALGSLLLAVLVLVFLLSAAGHRRGTDEIKASFVEKIPFDLFTALILFAWLLLYALMKEGTHSTFFAVQLAAVIFALLCAAALGLLWCMSFAVRVKQKTLLRKTICWRVLALLWHAARELWGWVKMLALSIPLVWRGILIFAAAAFVGLLLAWVNRRDTFGLWLAGNIILFPLSLWGLVSARRLRDGAKEIANGNTSSTVSTKYLFGEFRRHAEDLNQIQSGISRAVDARLRSEKMKTELITNVSHDIKTPLTSIISYIDLLSKEEIEGEQAREYIEVLRRQSARLKKLTDDLVEASKASAGALPVTIENCDLAVMLEQTAGEYGERLAEKNLTLVLRKPDKAVTVRADARHTQRIFDNLMSNILKYALPGTRVYLELTEEESGAAAIFRNTSCREIVLSAEELTERFVRGDASRSSEGSGLGLSIARSLAELQGGSLAVTVDGDLFKVTLGFAK